MTYLERELAFTRQLYAETENGEPPLKEDGTLHLKKIIPGIFWSAQMRALGSMLDEGFATLPVRKKKK